MFFRFVCTPASLQHVSLFLLLVERLPTYLHSNTHTEMPGPGESKRAETVSTKSKLLELPKK